MAFDPDAYLKNKEAPRGSASGFDPDVYLQSKEEKASPIESGIRHLVNAATLNFSDEGAGATEAVGRAVGIEGAGGPIRDIKIAPNGPTLDWETLRDAYRKASAKEREALRKDMKDNPVASGVGMVAGAIMSPANKIMPNASMAKSGAVVGGLSSAGASEAQDLKGFAIDTGIGVVGGAVFGKAMDKATPLISKGAGQLTDKVRSGVNNVGEKLQRFAEKTAVNATGATGKQASNFSDDAGRELLDRGIVRFGDSQEKIAERATSAVNQANKQIDDSLSKLESAGVKVDANNVYNSVQKKITELKSDPSQADIVRLLEKELENLVSASEAKGTAEFGIKEMEKIKRGYNRKAGNWADPEKGQAGKEMYQTVRRSVEDAGKKADPNTAALFEEGKKSYGLLTPIQEAAERRAATTAQSPAGGFLDVTTSAAGAFGGGPVGAIVAPVARRIASPRISSSVAVTADKAANMLLRSPKMKDLSVSNPKAFQAAVIQLTRKIEEASPSAPAASADPGNDAPQPKLKGQEKWANDGFEKLQKHSPEASLSKEKLLSNPKAKRLLISASDLKPGSKAMNKIIDQLSELEGQE